MRRDHIRTAGAVLLALALVGSLVTGGIVSAPIGEAEASHSCGALDHTMRFIGAGSFLVDVNPRCAVNHVEEIQAAETEQTELRIYSAATAVEKRVDENLNLRRNYLQDTQTVAYSKGEAAAKQAMNNNKSEAEVIAAGRQAVQDYYTLKQINLIKSYEIRAFTLRRLVKTQPTKLVKPSSGGSIGPNSTAEFRGINGSTIPFEAPEHNDGGTNKGLVWDYNITNTGRGDTAEVGIEVAAIDASHPSKELFHLNEYGTILNDTSDRAMMAADNVEMWADATYDEFKNNNLSSSAYLSGTTIAQEFSTNYNDTGYWSYAVAALATSGLSTPDLNQTSHMVISTNDGQYTGLLMTQYNPSDGAWEVGTTYDAAVIPGEQFVVTDDGHQVELTGEFEITEMKNLDGQQMSSTEVQEYNYAVTDTEGYKQLQQNLSALQESMEERESTVIGGGPGPGSGGGGSVSPAVALGAVAAVGAAFVLLNREQGPPGGNR